MDSTMILLLLFLACELFVLFVFVVVRLVLPPIKPIELNEPNRGYIVRANRDRKTN